MRRATDSASVHRGSLIVVGTGIRLVGQATLEAVSAIEQAAKVFFLVNDPATIAWIRGLNPTAESLADCYVEGIARTRIYRVMAERIVSAVQAGLNVCAAFYGHPGVFVDASHEAIRQARLAGCPASMMPGISAEACLFADLGVDPAANGCQSFEATDFLLSRRKFDPSSALILWQVGVLGEASVRASMSCRPERLAVLTRHLERHYPPSHRVVLYEAAQYPVCDPVVKKVTLARLRRETILPMTTLYVPPVPRRRANRTVVRWIAQG